MAERVLTSLQRIRDDITTNVYLEGGTMGQMAWREVNALSKAVITGWEQKL